MHSESNEVKVIIFDLDDTLYDERHYVESGFRAVANFGFQEFGWEPEASFNFMIEVLDTEGRGAVFDRWLTSKGAYTKKLVQHCVSTYRHHTPKINLLPEAEKVLNTFASYPIYIVTDGHKIVQQKKIEALGLASRCYHVYITHRYGLKYSKPSIYCFEKIRERENCKWHNLMYVGDNPAKDFVNLNPLGVSTVRVLTGIYRAVEAKPTYDAFYTINSLNQIFYLPCFNQGL